MIEKLEYLIALAHEKHFGRAAESCAVSQPSLSLGLKQLEEQLGVLLVQRGSRFIGLTPEGERTLEWARRIVGDARAMRQDIKTLKQKLSGRLKIAVIPAALPMVATITQPLHARHPEIEFTILSRPWVEMEAMLDNLEIDAAVTYLDLEPLSRVNTIPLYREQYRLLVSADSPLASRSQISWAEAARQPLCLLTTDTQNRRIIEETLRSAGGDPQISLESDSMAVLFAHVRSGTWTSIVPEKVARAAVNGDFALVPLIEPEIVHTIGLVTPLRDPTTPLSVALAAEARRAAVELMA
ncbi:MAG: LysR family transcriptional regulator [Pseudolabrys sp.]|nr:LysR family transcriptional regulator [Pseudolabrys sp.]